MSKDYIKTTASVVLQYSCSGKEGFVYVKTAKDDKWGLPAGKLNLFENDHDGIIREVWEETGLDIVVTDFLGIWDFESDRGSAVSNRVYLGKAVGGELKISRPEEILDLSVLSVGDIRTLYKSGDIRSGKANLRPVERYLAGEKYPLSIVSSVF